MLVRIYKTVIVFVVMVPIVLYSQEENRTAQNDALTQYKIICSLDSNNYGALNNLGNTYFLLGYLDSAEVCYVQAEKILDSLEYYYQPIDTAKLTEIRRHHEGVYLNLGTLYTAVEDTLLAHETYSKVVKDPKDLIKVEKLLGISFGGVDHKQAKSPDITVNKIKHEISKVAKKQTGKQTKSGKKKEKPKGKKVSKVLGVKRVQPKGKVTDVFYWINKI